ncbi:MAG: hypothetical protein QM516_05745 [Limnohabitans sp.]|nr:hypothetical protein [Limnohabitans sp.]
MMTAVARLMVVRCLLPVWTAFFAVATAFAQYSVPSNGGDGVFAPATSIEIDLSKARTGNWNDAVPPGSDGDGPFAGRGVYDAEQWLIVFHYESINIPVGVTVTFKNHPKNAPVVWLVQGDVVINGRVDVSGRTGTTDGQHGVPGPGGFAGSRWAGNQFTGGFGPGAGASQTQGYESVVSAISNYGNSACFPLIGGSGAGMHFPNWSSGGGGGAILIASQSKISVNEPAGSSARGILANGGWLSGYVGSYQYSSAGMIRLAAPIVEVFGRVEARTVGGSLNAQREGRIRVEATTVRGGNFGSRFTLGELGSQLKFLRDADTPTVKVVEVNSASVSPDPDSFVMAGFNQSLPTVSSTQVTIRVECRNVPANATVVVYLRSTETPWSTTLTATRESGDDALSIWRVAGTLGIQEGRCTVQAKATLP